MNLQEIIERMEEDIVSSEKLMKEARTQLAYTANESSLKTISYYLPHLKKLNETIVSGDEFCHCKSSNVTNRICNRCKKIVNYKLPGQN